MEAATFVCVVASCLFIVGGEAFPTSDNCESDESCVLLESCGLLCDVMDDIDTNFTIRTFITSKHCGFESSSPLLCCPKSQVSSNLDCARTNGRDLDQPNCGLLAPKHERIVGGANASPGDWPWVAALMYKHDNEELSLDCGGTLISRKHVLTAAHCQMGGKQLVEVRVGDTDQVTEEDCLETGSFCYCEDGCDYKTARECVEMGGCAPKHQTFTEFTIKTHPEFRAESNNVMHNDLTIIILDQPVEFTDYVIPVCLPNLEVSNERELASPLPQLEDDGTSMVVPLPQLEEDGTSMVVGWGNINPGLNHKSPEILQQLEVSIYDRDVCHETWKKHFNVSKNHLCAGTNKTNEAVCRGDSGGPLVRRKSGQDERWELMGVTSFGLNWCGRNFPTIFTRVTQYLPWIRKVIRQPAP